VLGTLHEKSPNKYMSVFPKFCSNATKNAIIEIAKYNIEGAQSSLNFLGKDIVINYNQKKFFLVINVEAELIYVSFGPSTAMDSLGLKTLL
jgi:hypothetical protein